MAVKPFHFLSSLILLLSLAFSGHSHSGQKSAVSFIKQLRGCHKGNKSEGIHHLKLYLKEFGYLPEAQTHSDYFDSAIESAVKTYQQNFHLKHSGTLDPTTISTLVTPRCGVPDIINGTNYMHPHRKTLTFFQTVSHYTIVSRNLKWSKTQLTYRFLSGFPQAAMPPVRSAFQRWSTATQYFSFSEVPTTQASDLAVGFYPGAHGDNSPFDGRGGVLAHAYLPTDGRFHYDADERGSVGPVQNYFNLETVAVHEIGHLLGLGHSQVREAIMFPSLSAGTAKNIHSGDILGIRDLYNY
ncbi:hypothetical protein ACS0TY_025727 [Phlomoides rotata]